MVSVSGGSRIPFRVLGTLNGILSVKKTPRYCQNSQPKVIEVDESPGSSRASHSFWSFREIVSSRLTAGLFPLQKFLLEIRLELVNQVVNECKGDSCRHTL